MKIKLLLVVLCCFCYWQYAQAQNNSVTTRDSIKTILLDKPNCDTLILVTTENINNINSIYQLTFLHKAPKTRLDSLVSELLNYRNKENMGLLVDDPYASDLFDSIGQLRSKKAYSFLYILCELSFEGWSDKPIKQGALGSFECFIALNKYFLNNEINTSTNQNYNWDIRELYSKNPPTVYYCLPEDPEKKYIRLASEINTKKYDDEIIHIIYKHRNLKKFDGEVNYFKAMDTILKEIKNLEYVEDAYYNYCIDRLSIYPINYTLGVIINAEDKKIEKCYDIQVGEFWKKKRFLSIRSKSGGNSNRIYYNRNYIQRGFIEQQRELCDPIPRTEDLWKIKHDNASKIVFKDTINDFVVDSSFHNLGQISSNYFEIVKYYKYIGDDTVSINNINDDPHFISFFNQTKLVKNQVYQFTALFHFDSIEGGFNSKMGFELSNGKKVMFEFTGYCEHKEEK